MSGQFIYRGKSRLAIHADSLQPVYYDTEVELRTGRWETGFELGTDCKFETARWILPSVMIDLSVLEIRFIREDGSELPAEFDTNASSFQGGVYRFDHESPQITVTYPDSLPVKRIEIHAEIVRFGYEKAKTLYIEKSNEIRRIEFNKNQMLHSNIWRWGTKLKSIKNKIFSLKTRLFGSRKKRKIRRAQIRKSIAGFERQPLISIIMPVYNTDPKWLERAVRSVTDQIYPEWELCIADDGSTSRPTVDFLKRIDHPRIKIRFLETNRNISVASNAALELADGEYVAFLDHDDEITSDALYHIAKVVLDRGADFIYSDEAYKEIDGSIVDAHLKPDYSPEFLLSVNYICHFTAVRSELIKKIGGFRIGYEGSQDHDLFLRLTEMTDRIVHIPEILYYWRKIPGSTAADFKSKDYAWSAGKRAVEDTLYRRKIKGVVEFGFFSGNYHVIPEVIHEPIISVIISGDEAMQCAQRILSRSQYQNFELILSGVSESFYDGRIRFVHSVNDESPTVWMNRCADSAKGEYLLFMDSGITDFNPDWMDELLRFAQLDGIGAVGAKISEGEVIYHAGIILGVGRAGIAARAMMGNPITHAGYYGRADQIQNMSAVSGKLMMIKTGLFRDSEGFDQDLNPFYASVDICIRLTGMGYRHVYNPYCTVSIRNPVTFEQDPISINKMKEKHPRTIHEVDPYYHKKFSKRNARFEII